VSSSSCSFPTGKNKAVLAGWEEEEEESEDEDEDEGPKRRRPGSSSVSVSSSSSSSKKATKACEQEIVELLDDDSDKEED